MTLAGLRSRWTTPFSWATSSPSAICKASLSASSTEGTRFQLLLKRLALDEFHREVERPFVVIEACPVSKGHG